MPNVYVRMTKINNVVGRSDYISNPERQEEIVLHECNMEYPWEVHANFELQNQKTSSENNQARELVIALPNKLSLDPAELKSVCDELSEQIVGENKDFEYAVHWNCHRTNLHMHLLFSERENQIEVEPKTYKRDIWMDKDTHKLAKANAANAELVHKKGDVQRDKEGNIKYQSDIFKAKDKRFKGMKFTTDIVYQITQEVLQKHGYELMITTKDSPYLAQKKLYKNARPDYIQKASEWNNAVKMYNKQVKKHIEIEPDQYRNYVVIKQELNSRVKATNSEEKRITPKAIEMILDMAEWVRDTVVKLKSYVKRKYLENTVSAKWEETKEIYSELFQTSGRISDDKKNINRNIQDVDKGMDILREEMDSKEELIDEIEELQEEYEMEW